MSVLVLWRFVFVVFVGFLLLDVFKSFSLFFICLDIVKVSSLSLVGFVRG